MRVVLVRKMRVHRYGEVSDSIRCIQMQTVCANTATLRNSIAPRLVEGQSLAVFSQRRVPFLSKLVRAQEYTDEQDSSPSAKGFSLREVPLRTLRGNLIGDYSDSKVWRLR